MNNKGVVKVSKDVILNIIGLAALDVEGVDSVDGFRHSMNKEDFIVNDNRGINMEMINKDLYINLGVVIKMDYEIPEVAEKIQNNISKEINEMTGLNVKEINIDIIDLV